MRTRYSRWPGLLRGGWLLCLMFLVACQGTPAGTSGPAQGNTGVAGAGSPATLTVAAPLPATPTAPPPAEATLSPQPPVALEPTVTSTAQATPTTSPEPAATATSVYVARDPLLELYEQYEIVTLLPQDAIPAIDDPQFITAEEADAFYEPTEMVLGVAFNGDARAYSIPHLSRHEIVNDTVGGVKISVTW